MKQFLLFVCLAIAAIEFLSLRACFKSVRPDAGVTSAGHIGNSVVALNNGSVMVAKPGTISRDLIDWFNDKTARPTRFEIGWLRFAPNSVNPDSDTQVRLQRFADELRVNPTVTAKVQVCTSTSVAESVRLAALRADRLRAALVANGVSSDRIATQTCQRNSTDVARQDEQFIGIVLDHRS
jgi:hypothetical protein